MTGLPRPQDIRRADYQPSGRQEEFIVPLLRNAIARALEAFAVPTVLEARVLDVGCGRQPFRGALESMGYKYTGIDVEQNLEKSVAVVCAIDEPLPGVLLDRLPFDFVLCTEVLEHVADWGMAFHNLATLTRPGARLLVTCPHFYQLHEEPYDFWRPTPHALDYFGRRSGFLRLHQENAGDGWDVLGTLLANTWTEPAAPRLSHRAVTKLVSIVHRWVFRQLRSRRLQGFTRLRGPLYMSNVAVFERLPHTVSGDGRDEVPIKSESTHP